MHARRSNVDRAGRLQSSLSRTDYVSVDISRQTRVERPPSFVVAVAFHCPMVSLSTAGLGQASSSYSSYSYVRAWMGHGWMHRKTEMVANMHAWMKKMIVRSYQPTSS